MQIVRVTLTARDLTVAGAFYRDVLELPITTGVDCLIVTAGRSELVIKKGDAFPGAHHIAFGIAPADFEVTRQWLLDRAAPFVVNGSEVIRGPDGWNSRSLYCLGPEGIILEYIARDAHAALPGTGLGGRVSCVSEVGIGVPAAPAAVEALGEVLGLPP